MGEKTEVGLDPQKKYGLLVDGKLLVSRHLKARKMHDLEPINSHLQPQNMSFARHFVSRISLVFSAFFCRFEN